MILESNLPHVFAPCISSPSWNWSSLFTKSEILEHVWRIKLISQPHEQPFVAILWDREKPFSLSKFGKGWERLGWKLKCHESAFFPQDFFNNRTCVLSVISHFLLPRLCFPLKWIPFFLYFFLSIWFFFSLLLNANPMTTNISYILESQTYKDLTKQNITAPSTFCCQKAIFATSLAVFTLKSEK